MTRPGRSQGRRTCRRRRSRGTTSLPFHEPFREDDVVHLPPLLPGQLRAQARFVEPVDQLRGIVLGKERLPDVVPLPVGAVVNEQDAFVRDDRRGARLDERRIERTLAGGGGKDSVDLRLPPRLVKRESTAGPSPSKRALVERIWESDLL